MFQPPYGLLFTVARQSSPGGLAAEEKKVLFSPNSAEVGGVSPGKHWL